MDFEFTDGTRIEVGTMYGVGKNYAKHAKEMGGGVPTDPIIFIKPPAAYVPDGGIVKIPEISKMTHHEVELVVIIGKDCEKIKKEQAHEFIAGYAVGVDVTLRDIQNKAKSEGNPWAIAKGFATSAPISKVIPASQFGNMIPYFKIELLVNGEARQGAPTSEMERSVAELVSFLSVVFGLRRGDCIFTGTPEGVGEIKPGDKLHAELKGYVTLDIKVE